MAFPDRKYFQRVANETDFQVDIVEKVYRLCLLLEKIAAHPTFGEMLILRGGTALNFLYLDLPRLSVDIDFDFVGATEKEEMEKERPHLDYALKRIFQADGYEVKPIESYALTQYFLSYTSTIPQKDMIKVEINYLNRIPIMKRKKARFSTLRFRWEMDFEIPTLQLEELMASKAVTLLARTYSTDFYDLYRLSFLDNKSDFELAHKLTICLGCIEEENFLYFTPQIVDKFSFYDLKRELLPLLRKSEPLDLEAMRTKTKKLLTLLLHRDRSSVAFLKKFYKGEFAPQLLLGNYSINPKLKNHPGAKWRLQNLSEKQRQELLRSI